MHSIEHIAAELQPLIEHEMRYLDKIAQMEARQHRTFNHITAGRDLIGSGLHGLMEGPDQMNLTSALVFIVKGLAHFALANGTKWRGGA